MGFFDSMKAAMNKEKECIDKIQANSRYRNVVQRKNDYYEKFNLKNDSSLLREYNYASGQDKEIIEEILLSRGYTQRNNGSWGRL